MKRFLAMVLVLAFAVPSFAVSPLTFVEGDQVMYAGGTIAGLKEEDIGTFDTTQDQALVFNHAGSKLTIPYARITDFRYEDKPAVDLGVVFTIVISLFKEPRRRHFLHFSYTDDAGTVQVATFEVAKDKPLTLVPLIQSRMNKDKQPTGIARGLPNTAQLATR